MLAQEQTQIIRIPELSKLSVYFDLSRHFYLISINTTAAKKNLGVFWPMLNNNGHVSFQKIGVLKKTGFVCKQDEKEMGR